MKWISKHPWTVGLAVLAAFAFWRWGNAGKGNGVSRSVSNATGQPLNVFAFPTLATNEGVGAERATGSPGAGYGPSTTTNGGSGGR